jgi:hypothetical protein
MTTICTCGACGDRHPPRPAIDWTHYEADVLAFVELWLTETEAAITAIREGRKPEPSEERKDVALRILRAYFPGEKYPLASSVYLDVHYGRVRAAAGGGQYPELWRAGEGVIWPAHAEPDGRRPTVMLGLTGERVKTTVDARGCAGEVWAL